MADVGGCGANGGEGTAVYSPTVGLLLPGEWA